MAEITWSYKALKDIKEIAEFIAKDSVQYAEEQVNQFFKKAAIIEDHPYAGRIVPDINRQFARFCVETTGFIYEV